jgi:hypothetical protein
MLHLELPAHRDQPSEASVDLTAARDTTGYLLSGAIVNQWIVRSSPTRGVECNRLERSDRRVNANARARGRPAFEAERQALAMLDHVNIARVFDGGCRPYFVMGLVHGVPIT